MKLIFESHMEKIKIISLAKSTQRRAEFAKNNNHIDFEFVDGVDGEALSVDDIAKCGFFAPDLNYRKGAFGCAMSHLQLWQLAESSGQPVTIAEDDAIFRHDFPDKLKALLGADDQDWDIVLWGWNFNSILSVSVLPEISPVVMLFGQGALRKSIEKFQRLDSPVSFLKLDKCFGLLAYTISPRGFRKIMDELIPLKNLNVFFPATKTNVFPNRGIDIALCSIYKSINALVAFPPLVVTKNERSISTIQNSKTFDAA